MDSQPSPNPPRDDSDSPITRSRMWYSDGSVVLQAEATQFRVHISILSAASTVFKDMFEVAQASSNLGSQVENCPLVLMYHDSAKDVEIVLDALYDRNFYKSKAKSFPQVSAMWRLGGKYGFDELRQDALERLQYIFPTTLAEFQYYYYYPPDDLEFRISPYPGLAFDAINLARASGPISILPAALFVIVASWDLRAAQERILVGRPRQDGTIAHLSGDDKTLCILAISDLLKKQWDGPYAWLHEATCDSTSCRASREEVMSDIYVPLPSLVALVPEIKREIFCPDCVAFNANTLFAGQKAFWEDLPSIFGLPCWEDIRKEMDG